MQRQGPSSEQDATELLSNGIVDRDGVGQNSNVLHATGLGEGLLGGVRPRSVGSQPVARRAALVGIVHEL